MSTITELIVDAYGCRCDLSDVDLLERAARKALEGIGASVVKTASHRFQPHGLTLCLILMESHFLLSTWPEHGLAVVNVFLCNGEMDPREVWQAFSGTLLPTDCVFHSVSRELRDKGSGKELGNRAKATG